MKKMILGAALLICGMIGIASFIVSCVFVATGDRNLGIDYLFGSNLSTIHLTVPLIIFVFLLILGVVFVIGGFRDRE